MRKIAYLPQPLPKGEKPVGCYIPGYRTMKCAACSKSYSGAPTSRHCKPCALAQTASGTLPSLPIAAVA